MVNVNNSYVATPPIDGGVLHSGPLGTNLPNDALEALDPIFVGNDHGAVGENGIAINRSKTTQKIRMFGGGNFRTVITETDHSVKITLLEDDNPVVLETINGADNVIVHDADEDGLKKTIYHTGEASPIQSWVIDTIDGEKSKRYVIEKGQVTELAEVTDVHTNVTQYQITIETYGSKIGGKGVNCVELRNDASKAIPASGSLTVTTTTLPAGVVGTPYSETLTATGGTGSKTWSKTGTLPTGLTLSTSGVLSGTPTAAGTPSITFKVTDSATPTPAEATKAITVTVTA